MNKIYYLVYAPAKAYSSPDAIFATQEDAEAFILSKGESYALSSNIKKVRLDFENILNLGSRPSLATHQPWFRIPDNTQVV